MAPLPRTLGTLSCAALLVTCGGGGGAKEGGAGTPTPPPDPPPPPPPQPTALGVYGAGWAADSLNNHVIGGPGARKVSFRFQAQATGDVTTARFYWIINTGGSTGYAAGTGGTIRVEVLLDDGTAGHAPTGSPLGGFTHAPGLSNGTSGSPNTVAFVQKSFEAPVHLVQGNLYHVVFTNLDAAPATNWISVNGLVSWTASQAMPARSSTHFTVLNHSNGRWRDQTVTDGGGALNIPIMDLGFTDGHHEGNGYMEVWLGQPRAITSSMGVREVFTPAAEVRFDALGVRLRRTSPDGLLTLRVEQADGTVVATVDVPGLQAMSDRHGWVGGVLPATVTLAAGQGYRFVVSAPSGAFEAYPIRDGGSFGFAPGTVLAEGRCEFNRGSGWEGWDGWISSGNPAYVNGDLQFCLRRAP